MSSPTAAAPVAPTPGPAGDANSPMGTHMTLEFSHMEVLGMGIGVGAATLIALAGESNWLEGVMLLGVYAILGVTFFFIP